MTGINDFKFGGLKELRDQLTPEAWTEFYLATQGVPNGWNNLYLNSYPDSRCTPPGDMYSLINVAEDGDYEGNGLKIQVHRSGLYELQVMPYFEIGSTGTSPLPEDAPEIVGINAAIIFNAYDSEGALASEGDLGGGPAWDWDTQVAIPPSILNIGPDVRVRAAAPICRLSQPLLAGEMFGVQARVIYYALSGALISPTGAPVGVNGGPIGVRRLGDWTPPTS